MKIEKQGEVLRISGLAELGAANANAFRDEARRLWAKNKNMSRSIYPKRILLTVVGWAL
jgi:hypothetical protein